MLQVRGKDHQSVLICDRCEKEGLVIYTLLNSFGGVSNASREIFTEKYKKMHDKVQKGGE